jgi:hypothetical protein
MDRKFSSSHKVCYLRVKDEVKEAEQIRKSVYNILRQEQREQQLQKSQDVELQKSTAGSLTTRHTLEFCC